MGCSTRFTAHQASSVPEIQRVGQHTPRAKRDSGDEKHGERCEERQPRGAQRPIMAHAREVAHSQECSAGLQPALCSPESIRARRTSSRNNLILTSSISVRFAAVRSAMMPAA